MKTMLFFLIFIPFLLMPVAGAAPVTCTFRNGACLSGETLIYGMTGTANAHGSTSSGATTLCCTMSSHTVTNGCTITNGGADIMYKLSAPSNGHAAKKDGTYSTNVCFAATKAFVATVYGSDCATATPTGYPAAACVGSLSAHTNAHMGNCEAYTTKACLAVALDDTAPDITITTDPVSLTPGQDVVITATAADANNGAADSGTQRAGVKSIAVTYDGAACGTTVYTSPYPSTEDTSCIVNAGAVGSHTISVTATDGFDNSRTSTQTLVIGDTFSASLFLSKDADGDDDGVWDMGDGDRTVYAYLSHTGTLLTTCELDWGEGPVETVPLADTVRSHTYIPDGTKTVGYRCNDQFRGFTPWATDSIAVDTSAPEVGSPELFSAGNDLFTGFVIGPELVLYTTNGTPLFGGTAAETLAPLGEVAYRVTNISFPNSETAVITYPVLSYTTAGVQTVPALPATTIKYQFQLPPARISDGRYNISVRVTHLGGLAGYANATIVLDRMAPSGTIAINNNAPATSTTAVAIIVDVNDERSGIPAQGCRVKNAGGSYGLLQTCTGLTHTLLPGEGAKTVVVDVRDRAGNTQEFTDSILLDTTAPVVSVTGALTGFTNQDTLAGVGCADPVSNGVSSGCTTTSFALKVFPYQPGDPLPACPAEYTEYTDGSSRLITGFSAVCAAAKDEAGNTGFSGPTGEAFLVDHIPPAAGIFPFSPYTQDTSFTVGFWGGIDPDNDGGDLDSMDLQYNATRFNYPAQDFVPFLSGMTDTETTFGPLLPNLLPAVDCDLSFDPRYCVEDGYTYTFRVRARDQAGNVGGFSAPEHITVDSSPPTCVFLRPDGRPFPAYTLSSFPLYWAVQDPVSGVASFALRYATEADPTLRPLADLCIVADGDAQGNAACTGTLGRTYTFSCTATDTAGNIISTSTATTVTDAAGSAFMNPLPASMSNATSLWNDAQRTFPVSWDQVAGGREVRCFNVQYRNETDPFTDLGGSCIPPATTSLLFGPVSEGSLYQFRVRSTDTSDITSTFSDEAPLNQNVNTIVDSTSPRLNLTAFKPDWTLFDLSQTLFLTQNIDSVTITANATDLTSPLASQTLTVDTGVQTVHTCNLIPTGSSCPTLVLPTTDDFTLRVQVTDAAGNQNRTRKLSFVRHPVAGFPLPQVFLVLGDSREVDVTIRNIQSQPAEITLFLCRQTVQGGEQACPDQIQAELPEDGDSNPTTFKVVMGALSEKTIPVRLSAATIGTVTLYLASSSTAGGLEDSDSLTVDVGFPPEFPDMAGWSLFLMLGFSVVIYAGFSRKIHCFL